jgi:transposase
MRTVALDVHKRFAEVAVHEDGGLRRLGRIETAQLRVFAQSLGPQDHVVLESTAMTWAIAELLAEHAGRVTVSNPMRTRAIASAKVKTDKIDAKVLAQLGAADFLPEVWAPDEVTRALRRRVAHRSSLVRQRTRLRNQVHAVLARNLIDAPVTDVFGQGGRRWLADVALPEHEREQVDSNLRLHDALDIEVKLVERQLAEQALARRDVRHLMTIPGVGAITALALAVIGDVTRFPSPRQLVGYLAGSAGPSVRRQSGAPRSHLARRPGARSRAAHRGGTHRDPHPRPAARLSRPHRDTPRQADRALRDRAQARRAGLAFADQGRGLPLRRADDHPAQAAHAAAQGQRQRPEDQPRRRDQAQGARAPLPRGGRAQLPTLRRPESSTRRGCRQRGHDCQGRQSARRCAASSTVPHGLLFSYGVTRARKDSYTQRLTFSSVCEGWLPQDGWCAAPEPRSRIERARCQAGAHSEIADLG